MVAMTAAMFFSSCGATYDLGSNPNDNEYRDPVTGIVHRELEGGGSKKVIDTGTIGYWYGIGAAIAGRVKTVEPPKSQLWDQNTATGPIAHPEDISSVEVSSGK